MCWACGCWLRQVREAAAVIDPLVDGRVGYIIGAYRYGDEAASSDRGQFILTLRQRDDGHWLIVADLDAAIRQ